MANEAIRSLILGAQKSPPVPFDFKGTTLWVRQPSVQEFDDIIARENNKSGNMTTIRNQAFVIADLVVDENGSPVFTRKDIDGLMSMEVKEWKQLSAPIQEILEGVYEAAAKK